MLRAVCEIAKLKSILHLLDRLLAKEQAVFQTALAARLPGFTAERAWWLWELIIQQQLEQWRSNEHTLRKGSLRTLGGNYKDTGGNSGGRKDLPNALVASGIGHTVAE